MLSQRSSLGPYSDSNSILLHDPKVTNSFLAAIKVGKAFFHEPEYLRGCLKNVIKSAIFAG